MVFALHNNNAYFQFITKLLSMCFIFCVATSPILSVHIMIKTDLFFRTISSIQNQQPSCIMQRNQFVPFFHFLNHKINDFYAKIDIPFIITPFTMYAHLRSLQMCNLWFICLFKFFELRELWICIYTRFVFRFSSSSIDRKRERNISKQFGKWGVRRSSYS